MNKIKNSKNSYINKLLLFENIVILIFKVLGLNTNFIILR